MTDARSLALYAAAILAVIGGGLALPRLDLAAPIEVVAGLLGVLAFASLLVAVGLLRDRRRSFASTGIQGRKADDEMR